MQTKARSLFSASLLLGSLLGCETPSLAPAATTAENARGNLVAAVTTIRDMRADEAPFRDLALEYPGFAGIERDAAGKVVILGVDAAQFEAVRGRLESRLRSRAIISPASPSATGFRAVKFSFAQLAAWRDSLAPHLFALDGWLRLDLNESENRIDIDVDYRNRNARSRVQTLLSTFGVPLGAVLITQGSPVERNQGATRLVERMRPLRAGSGIGPGDQVARCSVGAIASWGSDDVLLTAGHCTERDWGLDPSQLFLTQPYPVPATAFGPELFDRAGVVCGILNLDNCRMADVSAYSLAQLDVAAGETHAYEIGRIARPVEYVLPQEQRPGSIHIDAVKPFFVVAGATETLLRNTVVSRVGVRTGWQIGVVIATCVDHAITKGAWYNLDIERKFVCQSESSYFSDKGDSGGSVFEWISQDTVLFTGVHWGYKNGRSIFSSIQQLRGEMSSRTLNFLSSAPPPATYWASIVGVNAARSGVSCSWSASTNIGAPVTYDWRVDGWSVQVGTSSVLTLTTPSTDFLLEVFTSGANGSSAYSSKPIAVSSSGPECLDQ
jgi:hypothetical protein